MSTTEKALKGTAARSGADIRDAGPGLCHQADAGKHPGGRGSARGVGGPRCLHL